MSQSTRPWLALWHALDDDARRHALQRYAHHLLEADPELLGQLARRARFRPRTLQCMSPERLAHFLRLRLPALLRLPEQWRCFFHLHHRHHPEGLQDRLLAVFGLPPADADGPIPGPQHPPADLEQRLRALAQRFGDTPLHAQLRFLQLQDPAGWGFLAAFFPAAQAPDDTDGTEDTTPPTPEVDEAFTQLDRVLIEQAIATAAGEEGALDPDELRDLVETVHALNTRRRRTHFHLGFMDALLDQRPQFQRPENNDARRRWYLAGLLAGYVRQERFDEALHWIQRRHIDFEHALHYDETLGRLFLRTLFEPFLDHGHLGIALEILRHTFSMAEEIHLYLALDAASELLRDGRHQEALPLLEVLDEGLHHIFAPHGSDHFVHPVRRKLAQAYQAQGELERAREFLQRLLQEDQHDPDIEAKLLADLGLVEGGFTGLTALELDGDLDRRRTLQAALARGRAHFQQAVARHGDHATHAHYALALDHYLCYMDDPAHPEHHLQAALRHAQHAFSGMLASPQHEAYHRLGLVGRCRFMLAVLHMHQLEHAQAQAALRHWQAIDLAAGHFPHDHLRQLFHAASTIDKGLARQMAESLIPVHGTSTADILEPEPWLLESPTLRGLYMDAADNPRRAREDRFQRWQTLIPRLQSLQLVQEMERGLDTLEALAAQDAQLARRLAEWLLEPRHYDPAWAEHEALRVRLRCLERAAAHDETVACAVQLFHALRLEQPDEARAIRALVAHHDPQAAAELHLPEAEEEGVEANEALERRLRAGEPVRLLLVGGNETQAQYDHRLRQALRQQWPGVEIHFEHSGWSSNWGETLRRLEPRLRDYDAVVLMSMMRTLLGRALRRALQDRPWVACPGRGYQSLKRSLQEAARVGLRQRLAREAARA